MSTVGQRERVTQQQVLLFFQKKLGYRCLGDWKDRVSNSNTKEDQLRNWLRRQSYEERIINRVLRDLGKTAVASRYALSQPWASIFGPVRW